MNQDYLRRIQDSRRAPTVARKSIAKRRTTTLPAYSSGFRIHKRGAKAEAPQAPRSSAVGAKIEAPRAPMGWGVGTGMPLPRKIFSILDLKMATLCAFWALFYSSAICFKCKSVVSRVKKYCKTSLLGLQSKYSWWMCSTWL